MGSPHDNRTNEHLDVCIRHKRGERRGKNGELRVAIGSYAQAARHQSGKAAFYGEAANRFVAMAKRLAARDAEEESGNIGWGALGWRYMMPP